ncbi:unnamed protein product [Effrenium voratum]|nr:unnamed protein product [Effrenium voratum]
MMSEMLADVCSTQPSPLQTTCEACSPKSSDYDRSWRSSPKSAMALDLEAIETPGSPGFLSLPRERSSLGVLGSALASSPGLASPGSLPTVLGRRDCSKSSAKSVMQRNQPNQIDEAAISHNFSPSSPQSMFSRAGRSLWARRWGGQDSDEGNEAAASRESADAGFAARKWSVGVRTLLQLNDGSYSHWLSFSALSSVLLTVTALYAVFLAPRDDAATIAWRMTRPQRPSEELGCSTVDHVGFYAILIASAVAGTAACLMYQNAGSSSHILSAAGYALLNWFQGMVGAVLPAHERAKSGCAYGMLHQTFAPQELSNYDDNDYYKEYYGVIIVRTLLFLAGLIWMQHLMVRRVLAVEATSRRTLGGRCLATSIAVQKVCAIVACAVSIWIYTSIGRMAEASEEVSPAATALSHYHVSFWRSCSTCTYFVGLLVLQLILGVGNFLLFVATAVTVIVVMRLIWRDISKALHITYEFAPTHPRTRRAAQQLKRARIVVRRQLAGVAVNAVASSMLLPLAVKTVLDGRGYVDTTDLATSAAIQVLDSLTCVAAALILSGGYKRPIRHRQLQSSEQCSCQFATVESLQGAPDLTSQLSATCIGRASTAWSMKVADLAGRGVTLKELLSFYSELKTVMPHFKASIHTTHDVVRHAIIPLTKHKRSSYVQACSDDRCGRPHKMVTHWWGNRFVDLVAAVVADALEESSYGLVSRLMQKDIGIVEKILDESGHLMDCYWICAFCVNQHASICGQNHDKDSVTGQPHPLCDCGLPKYYDGDECEMNKFDEMMAFCAARDPNFCQVVAVDSDFGVFTRAWCMAEMAQASNLGITTHLKLRDKEGLIRTGARLRDLDVREMKASRVEDVEHILAKIPDKDAFNAALQNIIFDSRSGLLAAWRDLDSSRQMGEAGRLLFWTHADAGSGTVWKCWDF